MRSTTRRDLEAAGLPRHHVDTRIVATACPSCGATLDHASAVADPHARPTEGDLTLCADCGVVLIFDAQLHQRLATQEELDALTPDQVDSIAQAQRVIAAARSRR